MTGGFFGHEQAKRVRVINPAYPGIHTPGDLYEALLDVWCAETCTPRMRKNWSERNPTLGQCAITSFLAQDIFGGKVYGVPLRDGGIHCFNVVDGIAFDLTSEQFGDEALRYDDSPEQFRDIHFAREEKRQRYELLKVRLQERLCSREPSADGAGD